MSTGSLSLRRLRTWSVTSGRVSSRLALSPLSLRRIPPQFLTQSVSQYVASAVPASGPLALAFATGDFSSITNKIKEQGGDQLKELEATAQKLYKKAQEATKDGQGGVEGLFKKLQEGLSFFLGRCLLIISLTSVSP